jgi:prepilin-type processing-associated H-X9-DG protein
LVVTAIIAILAAALFPVFVRAKEKAHTTQCVNNLRQLGSAMMEYLQDWDEYLPFTETYFLDEKGDFAPEKGYSWKDVLFRYTRTKEVFLCPTNPVGWGNFREYWGNVEYLQDWPIDNVTGDVGGRFPTSYAVNGFVFYSGDYTYSNGELQLSGRGFNLSDIPDSAQTIALTETREPWYGIGNDFGRFNLDPDSPAGQRGELGKFHQHGGRINFAFFDGHVKSLKAIETLTPKMLWGWKLRYPEYPDDPLSLNHPLVKAIAKEYR